MKEIASIVKIYDLVYIDTRTKEILADCPECNGKITQGITSCPDKMWGCCVCHWGYGCQNCRSVYDIKFDESELFSEPNPSFVVKEEIGIGLINLKALKKFGIKSG